MSQNQSWNYFTKSHTDASKLRATNAHNRDRRTDRGTVTWPSHVPRYHNIARQKRKHRQHGLHGHDSNPKLAYVLSLLVKFQLYRYAVYRRPCGIKNGQKPPKSRYFPNFQVWVAFVPTTSPIWAKYGAQKYSHGIYLSAEFELARFTVSPFTCNCRPVIAGSQRSSANVTNTYHDRDPVYRRSDKNYSLRKRSLVQIIIRSS